MKKGQHNLKDKRKIFLELLEKYFKEPLYKNLFSTAYIDEERQRILAVYSGIEWQKISPDIITSNYQSIFFFSDEAFRYYLPAFMRACFISKDGNEVKGTIISILTPPKDNRQLDEFVKTMTPFSDVQKSIILLFLEIINEENKSDFPAYSINKVINKYWYKFKKYQQGLY